MPELTSAAPRRGLAKCPSGVRGLDDITGGGLPRGRPTIVCGAAGCGKTLLATEFLVRGATDYGEPGLFVAFEESPEELTANVRSLGFDLDRLQEKKKLVLDHIAVDRNQMLENGEYDLEGLFIRLGYAIDTIGAKRVVLDTIETLFGGFENQAILRNELQRLFRWLKEKGVTTVITAERGEGTLTRQGLEEYVSDCVILLDHRVTDQVSTRRLRVVKYRGSAHGTNEYPFLIDETGFSVLPITAGGLDYQVSDERISTGIPRLDAMLGGGLYRGSSALLSGTAGTGKSSLAAHFAAASCARGEKCLYFAFEESPEQIMRNMRSIGLNLRPHVKKGLLQIISSRPTASGMETHLATMHRHVREFEPKLVVVDPISNLAEAGTSRDAAALLTRLLDFLKSQQTTGVFTCLTGTEVAEATEIGISSVIDTWLLVRDIELGGERNRGMYVLKSRGTAHSNQIREFVLSSDGVDLLDVYVGPEGVLTGSMRMAQEAREKAEESARLGEFAARQRVGDRKRKAIEAQIKALEAELLDQVELGERGQTDETARLAKNVSDRAAMSKSRKADPLGALKQVNGKRGGARA
ncbi:MAG: circadian clock protein KaiC [Myxococcaceae bacterium]